MPIPLIGDLIFKGVDSVPFVYPILKVIPWLAALFLAKVWFGGASNKSERVMHSKVVMITVNFIHQPPKSNSDFLRVARQALVQR